MNKARRANGEGTLYERKKPNRKPMWVAALAHNGRRHVRYAATKALARKELNKLIHKRDSGRLSSTKSLTIKDFFERWLDVAAKPMVRDTTYRLYRSMVAKHIVPTLGSIRVDRLLPTDIQTLIVETAKNQEQDRADRRSRLLAALERNGTSDVERSRQMEVFDSRGISAAVPQKVYNIVHAALQQALKWDLVARNVADSVRRPRTERKPIHALTADEVKKLLVEAASDRLYALYALAVHTGMRQGELLALQWSDFDEQNSTVSVRRTLSPITLKLRETKTPGSVRKVSLNTTAGRTLLKHRERMLAEGLRACPFVFCDTLGHPIRKSNMFRRSFQPLLKRAGLPSITFHALRHTCASLLLGQGANVKQIQELLGHSSSRVTLDVYAHLMPTMQKEALAKLDRVLA